VRVETGVASGDEISLYYDSLLAKIIVLAESRPAALARLRAALQRTVVLGEVNTNLPFLIDLLADPAVAAGDHHTGFVEEHWHAWQPAPPAPDEADLLLALAGVAEFLATQRTTGADQPVAADDDPYSPWQSSDSFRLAAGPKDRL
jgi:acetyl/propionyl-CoA carboxylase alpha subunit